MLFALKNDAFALSSHSSDLKWNCAVLSQTLCTSSLLKPSACIGCLYKAFADMFSWPQAWAELYYLTLGYTITLFFSYISVESDLWMHNNYFCQQHFRQV